MFRQVPHPATGCASRLRLSSAPSRPGRSKFVAFMLDGLLEPPTAHEWMRVANRLG